MVRERMKRTLPTFLANMHEAETAGRTWASSHRSTVHRTTGGMRTADPSWEVFTVVYTISVASGSSQPEIRSTLNFGLAGGVIVPWGPQFRNVSMPISDRFFMGGHTSLLGNMKGPSTLLGFRTTGVGPSEPRRPPPSGILEERPSAKDTLGGDLAVSTFADLSFDLPGRALKGWGIHAHTFVCAGNLVPLTGDVPAFSLKKFVDSFRVSCGAGLVLPTKLFRLEVKYCFVLRQQLQDRIKRGIQVSLNAPQ